MAAKPTPANLAPSAGQRVFKLKGGRTVTGRVITDDPVYYTIEVSGSRQEIIIKEDLEGSGS